MQHGFLLVQMKLLYYTSNLCPCPHRHENVVHLLYVTIVMFIITSYELQDKEVATSSIQLPIDT